MASASSATTRADLHAQPASERLGGVRADFVANLGRRVAELKSALGALRAEPGSERARGDLRRRVHALSAGGKLLGFARLATELRGIEELLDAEPGALSAETADVIASSIADLPALAWGQASLGASEAQPRGKAGEERGLGAFGLAATALVVGGRGLADALSSDVYAAHGFSDPGAAFDVERTEDARAALELARALAPDVIVVDVDLPGGGDLARTLLGDMLTEPSAVLVVGGFERPEDAAEYVALGVARALPKPASPETLRRAATDAASSYARRESVRAPLGETTIDKLGARLAEELRRGLCDAADPKTRGLSVDLGQGTEILAALWGAVARIRDVATIRSRGQLRFSGGGPEGALPLAPWMHGAPSLSGPAPCEARRGKGRSGRRGAAKAPKEAPQLDRVKVVIADDDPAVLWFLSGVFRAAGAEVHEAGDGARALEKAFRFSPDLVVSDILMPELDGFALCRALKRDVVLKDAPVILLSWKEDLLQRVRELGGGADGYLRKEASAAAIVQRASEVLAPRRRVAARVAAGGPDGEVRGRLDGLTTRTLLKLVCESRPDARLVVRDASFLYEIDVACGRPASATRTSSDGSFQRGAEVLAALLGVGAGRFVVGPLPFGGPAAGSGEAPGESGPRAAPGALEGDLDAQLLPIVARARAAQRLLSGAALPRAQRIVLAELAMAPYLAATPEPARALLKAVAAGACPCELLTRAQGSASLLEDVLCDAAARGAVVGVFGSGEEDLLGPAVAREIASLRGGAEGRGPKPSRARPGPAAELPAAIEFTEPEIRATAADAGDGADSTDAIDRPDAAEASGSPGSAPATGATGADDLGGAGEAERARAAPDAGHLDGPPSDHVRLESGEPGETGGALGFATPVSPRAGRAPDRAPSRATRLEPRRSLGEAGGAAFGVTPPLGTAALVAPALFSHPDERSSGDPALDVDVPSPPPISDTFARPSRPSLPSPSRPPPPPPARVPESLGSLTPPPVLPEPPRPGAIDVARALPLASVPEASDETPARRAPRPSHYAPGARPEAPVAPRWWREGEPREARMAIWLVFAAAGIAFAVAARWTREHRIPEPLPPTPAEAAAPSAAPSAEASAEPAAEGSAGSSDPAAGRDRAADDPTRITEQPLRPGDEVGPGEGMLEIVTGKGDRVFIGGRLAGRGPIVKKALAPKAGEGSEVEVRVRSKDGEEHARAVAVQPGRLVRIKFSPPWSR